MRLFRALIAAQDACCHPGCAYGVRNCPRFWHRVFILHFGEEPRGKHPQGYDDPRWDKLFKRGYKRAAILLSRSVILQKAAE